MDSSIMVWILALFTLLAAVGFGLWQRSKADKALKEHHHTVLTERNPEMRRTDGAPGVDPQ